MKEQGIQGRTVTNWRGIFAPPGITVAQVAYWDDAFAKLVVSDDWKKLIDQNATDGHHLRSKDFAKFLETEYAVSKATLTELGFAKQ